MSEVQLEDPALDQMYEFLEATRRSEALHEGWVAPPRSPREYREYLRRIHRATHVGYFLRTRGGELAGVVNLNEIVRASFQSAYIGYFALTPHQGKGFMREGVRLVLDRAFGEQHLHRVEANIQPANEASLRLVRALGFRREGFSLRYLKVGGQWRDHERWAITSEEWAREDRAPEDGAQAPLRRDP
jgi:ribosomal-protein-alanine N-acetyltransferase